MLAEEIVEEVVVEVVVGAAIIGIITAEDCLKILQQKQKQQLLLLLSIDGKTFTATL